MPTETAVPGPVRAAGALVCAQGLASLVFALFLLVKALSGGVVSSLSYGEAGMFLVIAAAFLAPGLFLLRGRRGARNAAVFLQLLLIGGIWYGFGPAEWVTVDVLLTLWCVAVLVLLFVTPSRIWHFGEPPAE